jgi:hypothetical protein
LSDWDRISVAHLVELKASPGRRPGGSILYSLEVLLHAAAVNDCATFQAQARRRWLSRPLLQHPAAIAEVLNVRVANLSMIRQAHTDVVIH